MERPVTHIQASGMSIAGAMVKWNGVKGGFLGLAGSTSRGDGYDNLKLPPG